MRTLKTIYTYLESKWTSFEKFMEFYGSCASDAING